MRGCVCQECGKEYNIDLIISNYWWEKIKPKGKPRGGGLLCPFCIIQKLENYKEIVCLYLLARTTTWEELSTIEAKREVRRRSNEM